MGTYKNIDEFIEEAFPQENEIINTTTKSNTKVKIERIDAGFDEELKAIIEGAEETEAPASSDIEGAEETEAPASP